MPFASHSIKIGGREVVASGTFILGALDADATITVEDLTYSFAFISSPTHPRLNFEQQGPKGLRLVIVGDVPLGGAAWDAVQVGTLHSKPLRLAVTASAYSVGIAGSLRQISYTFTKDAG